MMKSVALLDSVPQDEDFVLVGNLSDFDDHDDGDDNCIGDNDSYDYCDDLSLSSNHQTITSTSNPLQVVRENFFSEKPATSAPLIAIGDSLVGSGSVVEGEQEQTRAATTDVRIAVYDTESNGLGRIKQPSGEHRKRDPSSFCFDPPTDEVTFEASISTDSIIPTTTQEEGVAGLIASCGEVGIERCPIDPPPELAADARNCFSEDLISRNFPSCCLSESSSRCVLRSHNNLLSRTPNNLLSRSVEEWRSHLTADEQDESPHASSLSSLRSFDTTPENSTVLTNSFIIEEKAEEAEGWKLSSLHRTKNVKHFNRSKRRKNRKIAKKAAAAAIALSQLTLRASSSVGSSIPQTLNGTNSPKRKTRTSRIKVANIAVVAEVRKSYYQHDCIQQSSATLDKKLR
ncbi:hypothetical protein ACA910_003203 [Epithemia clementina (nom. ined.)]